MKLKPIERENITTFCDATQSNGVGHCIHILFRIDSILSLVGTYSSCLYDS